MADTNFAMEQVKRIDKEVDSIFPTVKNFLNKTTEENRGQFLKELNDLMFEGDLKKGIPADAFKAFTKTAKKQKATKENITNLVTAATKVRKKFSELLDITAEGPVGMVPAPGKKLQINVKSTEDNTTKVFTLDVRITTQRIDSFYFNTNWALYQNGQRIQLEDNNFLEWN